MGELRWRVGRKLGRTLYLDDNVIGMVDTPALANWIVNTMNNKPPEVEGEVCSCEECMRHGRRCIHKKLSPWKKVRE
jgi:hypothetical protein